MIGYLLLGAAFIIGGLCFVVNNAYALKNPKIESFEGCYERVYRRPTSYLFENESVDLYLDSIVPNVSSINLIKTIKSQKNI